MKPRPTPPKDREPPVTRMTTVGALREWLKQFPANATVCAEYDGCVAVSIGNEIRGRAKIEGD